MVDKGISVSTNYRELATTLAAMDDLSLVHATKAGDVLAFEELVKRYDCRLFRLAQHVTHNYEDAQEAVQEAFLNAFQKLDQFQEHSKFSTWLIRIAINQSLMKVRKQRQRREVSNDQDFQREEETLPCEIADWMPNPEERYQTGELREILIKTLQSLGAELRVVFVLRDIDGLSVEKTAEALDLTVSAVKARLRRARMQLRERLSRYFTTKNEFAPVAAARSVETVQEAALQLAGEPFLS
jgi:RNA polymerase sigma-70 factor, ECF subfamily